MILEILLVFNVYKLALFYPIFLIWHLIYYLYFIIKSDPHLTMLWVLPFTRGTIGSPFWDVLSLPYTCRLLKQNKCREEVKTRWRDGWMSDTQLKMQRWWLWMGEGRCWWSWGGRRHTATTRHDLWHRKQVADKDTHWETLKILFMLRHAFRQ